MVYDFNESLHQEIKKAKNADIFYKNQLGASKIVRFDSGSKEDMIMQHQDIDVLLTIGELTYKVSEKFRDKDFGDLYVEVFSKYPGTNGWLQTGSPHAILYFMPKTVYWITHKTLAAFCLNELFPAIPHKWFAELYNSHRTIVSKTLIFKSLPIEINLIQAHNQLPDGIKWETIGISAPFDFFEKNGVKIRKIELL
jgi:hypothetical protein